VISKSYGDLALLHFERLSSEPGVAHAITTRPQNYAPDRGIGRADAIHWRRRVCQVLGFPFERLTSPEQILGSEVLPLEDADIGCGRDGRESAVRLVDGLITDRRAVPIILLSADCPLVCAYDPDRPAVGAVHASWHGTLARAAENLVRQMQRAFGSDPARLLAAVTPSAGPCCYEVSRQVWRIARTRLDDPQACFVEKGGRLLFDLWTANHQQLVGAGVRPERIETASICSICDERFWSHRRDGPDAGRFAAFLALR